MPLRRVIRNLRTSVSVALFLLFLVGCTQYNIVSFGDTEVFVEIADTPEKQQQGLMDRESLGPDEGMLFVFPEESTYAFWMKNTKIPLDIIYIAINKSVVDILSVDPCVEESCTIYFPNQPAQYVLEVNKGFAAAHGITAGSEATFKIS